MSDPVGTVLAVNGMREKRDMDITAASSGCQRTHRTSRAHSARRRRGGRIHATERTDIHGSRGLTVVEVTIIVALVVAVIVAAVLSGPASPPKPAHQSTIKVRAGESLWSIAAEHPVAGQTTPQTVDTIRQSNHLTGSFVAEGSVLRIPAQAGSAVALAR